MDKQEILSLLPHLCMSQGIHRSVYDEQGTRRISHMPVTLDPYTLKSQTYRKLTNLHVIWQKLITHVAADSQILLKISSVISSGDPYMKRLTQVYSRSCQEKIKFRVACTRIDYCGDDHPQLVEFNLMSVGLNGISDNVQKVSNILRKNEGKEDLQVNNNQQTICEALVQAMQMNGCIDGVVLMVVHPREFNFGDQNYFKMEMAKRGKYVIPVLTEELMEHTTFEGEQQEGDCYYKGQKVGALYFRTGYKPEHFPTEEHWVFRERIERSNAVKLPSIQMCLVNTKRMQAELAKRQVLQKYLDQEEVEQVLGVAGEIYDLDSIEKQKLEELVNRMKSQNFVLKPNREGGGNNFFDQDAYNKILTLKDNPEELKSYIVMKKIPMKNLQHYFVIDYKPIHVSQSNAEFSTFGSFVYSGKEVHFNKCGGSLVRVKRANDNEGGIAIGKAAIAGVILTQ